MSELQQVLEELRSLRREIRDQQSFGFSHGVKAWAQRIQIGEPEGYDSANHGGCAWYRWNANTRRSDVIHYEFLTGRITKIWIDDTREYKGKPNPKLMIRVEADCTYELVSSADNLFSRSFLWGIHKTPLDRFKDPVSIQVRPGWDKEKQKFTGSTWCNLNQGRDYLNRGYPKDEQGDDELAQKKYWAKIRQDAIAKFNYAATKNTPLGFSGTDVPQVSQKPSHKMGSNYVTLGSKLAQQSDSPTTPQANDRPNPPARGQLTQAQIARLYAIGSSCGWKKEAVKLLHWECYHITSSKDLSPSFYEKACATLQETDPTDYNLRATEQSTRLKDIAKTLGLPARQGISMIKFAIAELCGEKQSWQLTESEATAVRDKFLFRWAMMNMPNDWETIVMSELLAISSMDDEPLCYEWMDRLQGLLHKAGAAGAKVSVAAN